MVVISDASPIMNLASIGLLDLLPKLFQTVIIPPKVFHEIVVLGYSKPGSTEIKNADWVLVKRVQNIGTVESLMKRVDPGEAEAIALAIELKPSLLLIDELIGLLGILLNAKNKGLIPEVKKPIEDLSLKARFFMSESLINEVLRLAGEGS